MLGIWFKSTLAQSDVVQARALMLCTGAFRTMLTAGGNVGGSTEGATCKLSNKLLDRDKRLWNSSSINLSASGVLAGGPP